MEFDLPGLGTFLTEAGLMTKSFVDMDESEIIQFCRQVHYNTAENNDLKPPYLNDRQELVIPHDCPPHYRYWIKGNQPLKQTLIEMEVSNDILERYCPAETGGKTRFEKGGAD